MVAKTPRNHYTDPSKALVNKYNLTKKKREKTAMHVKDLAKYLQTTPTTTKKRFTQSY